MNKTPKNTQNKPQSGFKVRRSSVSRKEAAKRTVLRPDVTTAPEPKTIAPPPSPKKRPAPPVEQDNIRKETSDSGVRVGRVAPPTQQKKRRRIKNDFIKPTDVVRVKGSYDRLFLILVIVLTLFGLVMDFSASYPSAFSKYGDSFHYVKRQVAFAALGMIALFVAMHFDYRWLRKVTVPAFLGTVLLLIVVLAYGVASGVAQRWIRLGSITIQPSEIMKFSLVIMLALYTARNQDRITNYRNFWQSSIFGVFIPAAIVGIACVLIALERHFSGTIIVFLIGMVVIFAAGTKILVYCRRRCRCHLHSAGNFAGTVCP